MFVNIVQWPHSFCCALNPVTFVVVPVFIFYGIPLGIVTRVIYILLNYISLFVFFVFGYFIDVTGYCQKALFYLRAIIIVGVTIFIWWNSIAMIFKCSIVTVLVVV